MNHLLVPSDSLNHPLPFHLLSRQTFDCDLDDFYSYPEKQGWTRRTIGEWILLFQHPPPELQAFLQRWLFLGPLTLLGVADPDEVVKAFSAGSSHAAGCDGPLCQNLSTSEDWITGVRYKCSVCDDLDFCADCVAAPENPHSRDHPLIQFEVPGTPHVIGLIKVCLARIIDKPDRCYSTLHRWMNNIIRPAMQIHGQLALIDVEQAASQPSILAETKSMFEFTMQARDCDPRHPMDALATALMLECLYTTCLGLGYFRTHSGSDIARKISEHSCHVNVPDSLWSTIRKCGWCPFEIANMFRTLSLSSILFLRNVPRPDPTREHKMIRVRTRSSPTGPLHSTAVQISDTQKLCTQYRCSIRQLDNAAYETRHCIDCSGCPDVFADPDELQSIISGDSGAAGSIPLIMSINPGDDFSENIQLVKWEPGMSYAAISHVWSDGLGNLERNAIPWCQIRRLSQIVQGLQGKHENIVLFWLDTICVPPDGTGQDEAQKLALERMRQTYESASVVIVLDEWLMSNAANAMSDAEVILKVSLSNWNRRLWTYQEAALPQSLCFQFRDVIVDFDKSWDRICDDRRNIMTLFPSLGDVHAAYTSLRGLRTRQQAVYEKLRRIVNACRFRATSVATDEALCLAALLNLDMAAVVRAAPEKRMETFWSSLPPSSVPLYILQYQECMTTPGFRWAPRTLLASKSNNAPPELSGSLTSSEWDGTPVCGSVTNRGFSVKIQGLVFQSHYPLGYEFFIKDQHNNWLNIRTYFGRSEDVVEYAHDLNGHLMKKLKWMGSVNAQSSSSIVFIPFSLVGFAEQISSSREEKTRHDNNPLCGPGVLCFIEAEGTSDTSFVRKICPASYRKATEATAPGFSAVADTYLAILSFTGHSAAGNLTGKGGDRDILCCSKGYWESKEWCID